MQLISDWKKAHRLYSIKLGYFATACDIAMAAVVIIDDKFPFNPLWYVGLRLSLTVASMAARLLAQPDTENTVMTQGVSGD